MHYDQSAELWLTLAGEMSDIKYFLDLEENIPKYPWYGNKYLGDALERANTKPLRKQMKKEQKEKEKEKKRKGSRKRRDFKTVAGQIVTGNMVVQHKSLSESVIIETFT